MRLASLVDKPLIDNPLAGGGANANFNVSPPGTLNMNVTPPSIPVSEQTPLPGIIGDPLRPRSDDPLMQGFFDSEFYSPIATTNVVNYKFRGKDMQGSGSQASDFQKYLESIGQGNLIELSNESIAQQGSGPLATMEGQTPPGFGPQVIDQRLIDQTEFNQFPGNPNRKPADPIQIGGLGDQGLMDRLASLEQGIGSLQNQIANLFQMGQASDPFGLGGFMNTSRY